MTPVSFEEFEKLDLRVGKIIEADSVKGAAKLYKLKVRINQEERILVAGIAEHYAVDELLGKKVVVLTNLAPKPIKGIVSQGMLLAAVSEEESNIVLITPDEDVPEGTRIR